MVDIDRKSLYAQGLSANDVAEAVNAPKPDHQIQHGQNRTQRIRRPTQRV